MTRLAALRLPADVLAVLAVATAASFGNGAIAPLLGELREDFGVSFTALGLLTSGFAIARIVVDLPGGALVDRARPRPLLYAAAGLAGAGVLLSAMAPNFALLMAGRIVNGLGASLGGIAATAYVSRAAAAADRGKALGGVSAATQTGGFLSPGVVGLAAALADWRLGMAITAIPIVLAVIAVRIYVRPEAPPTDSHGGGRRLRPLGRMLFAPRALVPINILTVAISLAIFGFKASLLPLYGTDALRLSPALVGLAITISTALRLPVSIASGALSDRYGRTVVFIPGALLMALVSVVLTLAPNLGAYVAFASLYALGGATSPMVTAMVVDRSPRERIGAALGTNAFFRDLAIAGMPVALGAVIDASGYTTAGGLLAGFAIFAAGLAFLIGDTSPRAAAKRTAARAKPPAPR